MSIYFDLETRGISYLCPLNCFVNFSIIWFNMNCILQIVFSVLMTTINKLSKEPKYIATISCFAKCFLKIKIKHTVIQLTKETAMIRSLITQTLR